MAITKSKTVTTKKRKAVAKKKAVVATETDSAYILKMVMYLILGSIWVRIVTPDGTEIPLPIGFVIGALFAMHDHFQIDRKIEYAVLLLAALIGFWIPTGILITL